MNSTPCPGCGEPMDPDDTVWWVTWTEHFYCGQECARKAAMNQ